MQQVVWAPVREEYSCGPQYSEQCPASYDGLHPNELGEYQIARGFTRGLVSGLGIGKAPLEVPGDIPARPLPVPSNFQIATSDLGATATWDKGNYMDAIQSPKLPFHSRVLVLLLVARECDDDDDC